MRLPVDPPRHAPMPGRPGRYDAARRLHGAHASPGALARLRRFPSFCEVGMAGTFDRRKLVKAGSGAVIGAVVAGNLPVRADAAKARAGAELIFRGGTIITMDDKRRHVAAVAVAGGRIIAAGDEAEVMKSRTAATKIIELKGQTLMPSFIDAHGHFMNAPQIALHDLDPGVRKALVSRRSRVACQGQRFGCAAGQGLHSAGRGSGRTVRVPASRTALVAGARTWRKWDRWHAVQGGGDRQGGQRTAELDEAAPGPLTADRARQAFTAAMRPPPCRAHRRP